ncbi:hypothetical protein B7486_09185 [cyanobacterium TDX16]|nr:hypothetical protein B7486_09185 [cyanobacterium TDX16]
MAQSPMEDPPQAPDPNNQMGLLAKGMKYAGVATQFAVTLGVFGYIGLSADQKYACDPWGVLTGILLGMGLGIWSMLKQLEKLDKMK